MSFVRVRGRAASTLPLDAGAAQAERNTPDLVIKRAGVLEACDLDVILARLHWRSLHHLRPVSFSTVHAASIRVDTCLQLCVAPRLRELRLQDCAIDGSTPWGQEAGLTALELDRCGPLDAGVAAGILLALTRLQRLRLTRLRPRRPVPAAHWTRVVLLTARLPYLTCLDFTGSPDIAASPYALLTFIFGSPKLQEINLADTAVVLTSLPSEYGDFPANHRLSSADRDATNGFGSPPVQHLQCFNAARTPAMLMLLCKLAAAAPIQLEELDATGCVFMPGGVLAMLSQQTGLRRLVARGCIRSLAPPQVCFRILFVLGKSRFGPPQHTVQVWSFLLESNCKEVPKLMSFPQAWQFRDSRCTFAILSLAVASVHLHLLR
jgi:hypothetical protein